MLGVTFTCVEGCKKDFKHSVKSEKSVHRGLIGLHSIWGQLPLRTTLFTSVGRGLAGTSGGGVGLFVSDRKTNNYINTQTSGWQYLSYKQATFHILRCKKKLFTWVLLSRWLGITRWFLRHYWSLLRHFFVVAKVFTVVARILIVITKRY